MRMIIERPLVLVEVCSRGSSLRWSKLLLSLRYGQLRRRQSLRRLVELLMAEDVLLLSKLILWLMMNGNGKRTLLLLLLLLLDVERNIRMEWLRRFLAWQAKLMRQMSLVRLRNEIVLRVEVNVRPLLRWSLNKRLGRLVEIHRRTVHNSSLILWTWLSSLFLDGASWADAVLWQLNYGSYGTFDFNFVVNLIVGLAVVVVSRSEGYMNATVAFVLLRIGTNDGTEGRRFVRQLWGRRDDDWFVFVLILRLVVPDR